MTKEDLAEMERTVESHWHSEEDWADLREALPRLLEERKMLLTALRPFAEGANTITFRKMMYEAGLEDRAREVQAAADAIRFAEE